MICYANSETAMQKCKWVVENDENYNLQSNFYTTEKQNKELGNAKENISIYDPHKTALAQVTFIQYYIRYFKVAQVKKLQSSQAFCHTMIEQNLPTGKKFIT
jgi:hypothetical protein